MKRKVTDASEKRRPRLLYLAGPGDVISTYRHWIEGRDDPSQVAITYSSQFFDVCRDLGVEAKTISYHRERQHVIDGSMDLEHRPVPFQGCSGPLFHLGWWLFNLSVCWSATRGRYDTLVLMTGTHLWPYWPAKWLGKKIILTQHCVIWPKNLGQRGIWKLVHRLDRGFFRRGPDAIIAMSHDIEDQIEELTGGHHSPIIPFLPSYRRESFADTPPANHSTRPFRVLFAGRVERNKGILEVIEIARRLKSIGRTDIVFDVAGDGGAMQEVKRQIAESQLEPFVVLHGYCQQPAMKQLLHQSHAVILPTSAEMIEGFNKVVAEAVLSHRPWISSHLCPAVGYVRGSGIEVPPDNVQGYFDAVVSLADDAELYRSKVQASVGLCEQFYDARRGWAAALSQSLGNEYESEVVSSDRILECRPRLTR